jgi:type VI secretion system protein ImpL
MSGRITQGAKDLFNTAERRITGTSSEPAGMVITRHFEPIQRLMAGAPAPIDGIFEQIRKIREQLLKLGPQVGGASPLRAVSDPVLLELWRGLRQDAANLPSPVKTLIAQIAQYSGGSVSSDATRELENLYREQVVGQCRVRVSGRYPFGSGSEMSLTDFAEVFGYGGVYDRFFTANLEKLVDTSGHPWRWRPESVAPSPALLAEFEQADRIRQMFFRPGSKMPGLEFTVKLSGLDVRAHRFYLDIGGQAAAVAPGGESKREVVWPDPDPQKHYARAAFEDDVAAPEYAVRTRGPWAWFKFVDAKKARSDRPQPDSDLSSVLSVSTEYHQALITIEASNETSNPFATHEWRQFKCEP